MRGIAHGIICSVRFNSQHQVRSLWAPAITDAELDGFNVTLFKQLCGFDWYLLAKSPIGPKKQTQLPARLIKTGNRYAGVTCSSTRLCSKKIANLRKMVPVR